MPHKSTAKVVLSGYDCEIYRDLYGDWKSVQMEIANHAASGKEKRPMTEVLWFNWAVDLNQFNQVRSKRRRAAKSPAGNS